MEQEIALAGYVDNNYCDSVKVELLRDTIDLINRQKAEIVRLQSMNQAKLDMIHDLQAEIERFRDIGKIYSEVRAEAIKEFAERLKDASFITGYTTVFGGKDVPIKHITTAYIDSLVKEMTAR